MNLVQILLVAFYPCLLISIGAYLLRQSTFVKTIRSNWTSVLVFSIVFLLFINAYTIWHMSQEQFIYYWDFSGFWRRQLEVMDFFRNNPSQLIPYVNNTLILEEYSSFPQLLLIPHILIVGETYPRFVLAMVNSFLVPSQILLYIWILTFIDKTHRSKWWTSLGVGLGILFFTGNYLPLLLGYVGSAGLLWIVIICILMSEEKDRKLDVIRFFAIGVILVLLVFIRRWFAYYVLAFFLVTPVAYLLNQCFNKSLSLKSFITLLINLFLSGISALGILLVGFLPLVNTFTQYDYKFAYQSVYTGLGSAIPWFINFYSPLQFILLIIGATYGLFNRSTRETVIQALGSIIFVIILFYQVQIFGSHHYYIINIYSQFLILMGIISVLAVLNRDIFKPFFLMILSVLLSSNFLIVFLRQDTQLSIYLRSYFQSFSSSLNAPPRRSPNVDIIRTIVEDLQNIASEHEYIYVLAGSGNINDDMLRNALLPEQLNPLPSIEATKQLDTRDGVPKDFFVYTYIVVADPIQYHNGAPYQRVIGELANGLLHDDELKPYYYPLKDYRLNDGSVKVTVFKRIEDIPDSIREKYRELFRSLYPDYPFLYEFN